MTDEIAAATDAETQDANRSFLFAACFVALIATSFSFIIRIWLMDEWQIAFGLSETQKGEIFGAGFWPFGVSIVLFSLVIDKIGYGRSMIFAFVCHLVSVVLLVAAKGYWPLYWGSILNGLAAGTVEAVINPAVATMYPKQKTKMLTILHAGWPGGMALGGVLLLCMGDASWKAKVLVVLVPVIIYGIMLLRCKFPVSERVAAGVSYREMLREVGAVGAMIAIFMIMVEIGRVFSLPSVVTYGVVAVVSVVYFAYAGSLGRVMYILLVLVHILLAITELGTDAWIKELRDPAMQQLGLNSGLIVIYTASIMMILRFCIAPIERALKPLGVLFVSALLAAAGLYFLARAETPLLILITATIYGTGQCFFWPVTLGVVAERFPKGGAMTLNAIAGVGMLGVGIIGAPLMGYIQDGHISNGLNARGRGPLYDKLASSEEKMSIVGKYRSLDIKKVQTLKKQVAVYEIKREAPASTDLADNAGYQELIKEAYDSIVRDPNDAEAKPLDAMVKALTEVGVFVDEAGYMTAKKDNSDLDVATTEAKENAMATVAILPLIMAAVYLGLILYFKAHGGYKAIDLMTEGEEADEESQ